MTGLAICLTFAAALLLPGTQARFLREDGPAPAPAPFVARYPDRESNTKCEELCKVDSGMDADLHDCMTECAVSTDLMTHHLDDGFHYFAKDESYNEKNGTKIKELHNEKYPNEVLECLPEVDLTKVPQFADLDTNNDKVIDAEESARWSEKACVPDEMAEQVFSEADYNQDKVIDESEFKDAGEDTKNEKAMDKAFEKVSEGDDEYNSVQNPPLEEFDENKNGALDESEAKHAFKHELERRTEHADGSEEKMKELEPEVQDAIDKVDTNDDGEISSDEYDAKDGGTDFGTEMKEAADADEDGKELDDLPRVDAAGPAAAPAAAIFLAQKAHKQHSQASFLRRKAWNKYGTAILRKAQQRHRRA